MTDVSSLRMYPGVLAGHGRPPHQAITAWLQVAWLMLAEGRAYAEDLVGGQQQPQMQQAARLRFLEQLADVDNRLAGRVPVADGHCLAVALEHGLSELAVLTPDDVVDVFGLDEEFGGLTCDVSDSLALWQRLEAEFPGELPDRLVAQGQRDMLLTLRTWAALARSVGLDVGLLTPLLKDA
jgi:hypothetical protein